MQCPSCQAQNPASARFCNQCGTSLAAAASSAPAKSYTPQHLVDRVLKTRAAMQGEHKRVTVLFADIKGSTRLAEQAGAEGWHGILDRFFGILAAAVHRYEGTVNQYTGDGIMALFGAPVAHEDHAQRACFAALEMQAELRRYADELRLQKQLNLSMRVGLNTGEVIVGRIGDDLRMDYTAQGLTVNLAARLEHICEPGRIYLSRYTAALVEGYFKLRALGEMHVEGVDHPIDVFELEGEGAIRSRLERQLARGGSAFIGRETEIESLLRALSRVRAGRGQVVLVAGEAGIGKSRLCHEFAQLCEADGVAVHRASGVAYGNARPMLPARALLKSRLGLGWHEGPEEIRRRVREAFGDMQAEGSGALGFTLDFLGAAQPGELAPEQAAGLRAPMLRNLVHYLPRAEAPQVLMIEDLHFLDAASEAFVAQLAAEVGDTPTLLLLNVRGGHEPVGLMPHLTEAISLPALQPPELERLLQDWLGSHETVDALSQMIIVRAAGNPFFVEEAVQALVAAGHLRGNRGAYRLPRAIGEWPIPDTVHALIAARIDRLPEAHKNLLHQAAVIGPEFDPLLLAELAVAPAETVESGLRELERAGFLQQRRGERGIEYGFCQPLLQEVAYTAQLESARARVHAQLAATLEARYPAEGPPSEPARRIAHHWNAASDWARAGSWNLLAARWAATRDVQSTLHHYQLAMQQLDRAPETEEVWRLRIAARAGMMRMAQFVAMDEAEVERAYAEGRKLAEQCADVASRAELLISYGNELLHRGDPQQAAALMAEAVRLCQQHGQAEMVGRFRLGVLLAHSAAGRPSEGVALVNAGAGDGWLTRPIDEENYMSRALHALYLAWSGDLAQARADCWAAMVLGESEDRAASWIYANLIEIAWFSGDHEGVLEWARIARRRARAYGSDYFNALALRALALAHHLQGQPQLAVPLLLEARPLVARGGAAHQFQPNFLALLADVHLAAGDAGRAATVAAEAVECAQRAGFRVWEIRAWIARLALPQEWLPAAEAERGRGRVEALIASTGAAGFTPWLSLSRSRRASDPVQARQWRQQARREFAAIGATGHVQRLDETG